MIFLQFRGVRFAGGMKSLLKQYLFELTRKSSQRQKIYFTPSDPTNGGPTLLKFVSYPKTK